MACFEGPKPILKWEKKRSETVRQERRSNLNISVAESAWGCVVVFLRFRCLNPIVRSLFPLSWLLEIYIPSGLFHTVAIAKMATLATLSSMICHRFPMI
jgi:hypothetical protein